MRRRPVVSTTIASVGYNIRKEILEIEFTSGNIYQYFDVPERIYHGLLVAASKGKYFNKLVKDVYEYTEKIR